MDRISREDGGIHHDSMGQLDPSIIAERLRLLIADASHQDAIAAIQPGRIRRDVRDYEYAARMRYTAALRRYVYNPPLLDAIFSSPWLKELFLRSFGYRGQTDFTIYPDCWIRDLPLLDIGERAYLADGIVLGSNQVSVDQQWLTVDRIAIGARTIFDQQCMVGYGSQIAAHCSIGLRAVIGTRTRIGQNSQIGPLCAIGHHCRVGEGARLGVGVILGSFSHVADGVELPDYFQVPQFSCVDKDGLHSRRRPRLGKA